MFRKIIVLIISVILISGIVLAGAQNNRYFLKTNNGLLRATLGVTHNFDNGFTTELTSGQLKALEMFGVEIELVPLYHISAPEKCSPWPACKSGGGEPATRAYFPSDQTPWGIEKIYNDPNIALTSGGLNVDVAVLDTGVYKEHLDLKNKVKQCKDFTKGLTIKNSCGDNHGHGTHVSGTILADAGDDKNGIYGVAPEANLFAYKVCGNDGSCWSDDIATGIRFAADQGTEIISMSLGGDTQSSLIRDAIDYATNKGVLIIAAAGNDGPEDGSIDYPGANAKVIAVGAIDVNEQVPNWSSRGLNNGDYIVEEKEVEFAAPGVSVESTWPTGYNTISGTSMATPHVSGLAAKFWQGNAADTRNYLHSLARDIWTTGDDTATGFGLPTA